MWLTRSILFSITMTSLMLWSGCGGEMSASTVASAQQNYERALAAYEARDFAAVEQAASQALSAGGLDPDMAGEAYLMRAEARLELQQYDEAEEDLTIAFEGASDLSRVHALRGRLRLAQGSIEQARQEFDTARQMNPAVELPAELR